MTVEVDPAALEHAAGSCERAEQVVAGVAASLRAHRGCDTGRADTRGAVAAVLERLDAALVGLGATLDADAAALRSSAATYVRTDERVVRLSRR